MGSGVRESAEEVVGRALPAKAWWAVRCPVCVRDASAHLGDITVARLRRVDRDEVVAAHVRVDRDKVVGCGLGVRRDGDELLWRIATAHVRVAAVRARPARL